MVSLADVVATATAIASASARNDKVAALADLLGRTTGHVPVVVGLLTGEVRQGRIGVGWAAVRDVDVDSASESTLSVLDVDRAMTELAETHGSGSKARRHDQLTELMARATKDEAEFLATVLTGGLRQGALDGVMTTAIAKAAGVPVASVRRAAMFSGDLGETAELALSQGRDALDAIGLRIGRAVQPMLASTATSASEALVGLQPASIQAKLDGIRLQVHRAGDEVWLFTRNLNDITDRLPGVCDLVRRLDATALVLDGELVGEELQFFDILHRDGVDLVDEPLDARLAHLAEVVGQYLVNGITTADPKIAEEFASSTLEAGYEGVMVKALDSLYTAGRRGKTWRKVKPVHTYDLVVLAAEWGHGRRTGWLSNLHLGARDEGARDEGARDGADFVMVGKTFKGLTDELLAWQTEALLEREVKREGITVFVRPEIVVEIAVDGVHTSTTYPGGLALRFARVKQYRSDKSPADANTLEDLRALIS